MFSHESSYPRPCDSISAWQLEWHQRIQPRAVSSWLVGRMRSQDLSTPIFCLLLSSPYPGAGFGFRVVAMIARLIWVAQAWCPFWIGLAQLYAALSLRMNSSTQRSRIPDSPASESCLGIQPIYLLFFRRMLRGSNSVGRMPASGTILYSPIT